MSEPLPEDEEVISDEEHPTAAARLGEWVGRLVAVPLLLALLGLALSLPAGLAYAIYKSFPSEIQEKSNPGWVDLVLDNRYVIFALRVVLLSFALVILIAGVYIVVSMFVRMYRKEWLHKAGPFEAALAARVEREIEDVDDVYSRMLTDAWNENEQLEQRLEAALASLEEVTQERDELAARLP